MAYHIGRSIRQELGRQERTVAWFARKICCSRTNVYKIFEKDNLDIKLLTQISRVLNHDFFLDISENARQECEEENSQAYGDESRQPGNFDNSKSAGSKLSNSENPQP